MDDARGLALESAPEGAVARAERQSAGRGRDGRAWVSPRGALAFTIVLRPEAPAARWGLLPLVVGLGVSDALRAIEFAAWLKWPNDVEDAHGRKVAGVLVEARAGEFALAGVGVNADVDVAELPPDVRALATSVSEAIGRCDAESLYRGILGGIEARYRAFERGEIQRSLADYRARSSTIGRRVAASSGLLGRALDVDESGALVVEDDAQRKFLVNADEVRVVRA